MLSAPGDKVHQDAPSPPRRLGALERLRMREWEDVQRWFQPGARVLELGGGSGYQASLMANYGCEVLSIDLPGRPTEEYTHYPVIPYDGRHVPAPDASFDVIFSSNVLEHVSDLPAVLAELRRVLRPGGVAIHIMPSSSWRFWTSVSAFAHLMQRVLGVRQGGEPRDAGGSALPTRGAWLRSIGQAFVPHGEFSSAFAELFTFSRYAWARVFERHGWSVEWSGPGALYYSGYLILPVRSLRMRARLARLLGASTNLFITRVSQR